MSNIKSFSDFIGVNEEAEGAMYKTKLEDISNNAQKILQCLQDNEDLESWIQDKITIAHHNMEAILGYYNGKKDNKQKAMPLKGDMATGGMLRDDK